MRHHESQPLHLPCLMTTDHLLPVGKRNIRGNGFIFSQTLLDAIKHHGVWLVMQDSDGQAAIAPGDIVIQAKILAVDWLSADQICAEIYTHRWGRIVSVRQAAGFGWLCAQPAPLWKTPQRLSSDDILVTHFRQWLRESSRLTPSPWLSEQTPHITDPNQLCWYWLELLPLPLSTKQRLLRQPDSQVCLRYLKKIFRHSDRFSLNLR
ncbi:hypothetical protein [Vibrio quintilis]|uniref:Lon protease n=1 Tax=Vibrio quintilis TaxID=1117707 RepID=A0A1M7Z2U1_9VIBR|nr:hypothetical protein [Vibrio quintilis]SHO59110.1 hypothetical protein VQ7734_04887 [Vibrio quintilis]